MWTVLGLNMTDTTLRIRQSSSTASWRRRTSAPANGARAGPAWNTLQKLKPMLAPRSVCARDATTTSRGDELID